MQKRDVLSSPRLRELKKQRRKNLRNKIILYSVFFAIGLICLTLIARIPSLRIENINISGNKVIEVESVRSRVAQDISGYYFWLFPKNNFLLYPENTVLANLTTEFRRIKDVSFEMDGHKTLNINFSEREGKYLWCGNEISEEINQTLIAKADANGCYFMDDNGYIFDRAPYFSGNVYFKFYGGLGGDGETPEGLSFMPLQWKDILDFKNAISKMELKPSILYAKDDGDIELYLASNLTPPNAQKILFRSDSDLNKIAENLETALSTEPLANDFRNNFNNLLYIDLRFGNKVYYKFK
ncbi:MAG: hypothetical protein KBD55_00155 [Candidatus Pacebacteria bacterium]|nr:hypothetical protein [Candidatus Paceibacterota bacterium]